MMDSNNSSNGNRRQSKSGPLTRFKRKVVASLFCATSVSDAPPQKGDHLDESLTKSPNTFASLQDVSGSSNQLSLSTSDSETGLSTSITESGASSGGTDATFECTSTLGKLPENDDSHSKQNVNDSHMDVHAATSFNEQLPTECDSADTSETSLVDQNPQNLLSNGDGETIRDEDTADSGSLVTSRELPGFLLSDGEQDADIASILLVDMVSIHPNILSSSVAEISNREARRNSRRMFWDAFSRSSFRRNTDSPTIVFATSHAHDLGSHDRWLLDYSGDLRYDGVGRGSRHSASRSHRRNQGRWRARYGISERFHDTHDERGWQTSLCSTGLHTRGTCLCESLFMTEGSNSHTSFPQIFMLADALFEVLEEIRRHYTSLSLSSHSLPAPEAVVDSFPIKNHKTSHATESGAHDVQQCHICLVDYEEGDQIRVLPCCHEFHMSCVDKWLKEVHRVCPLCRDDVCKGIVENTASDTEISNL